MTTTSAGKTEVDRRGSNANRKQFSWIVFLGFWTYLFSNIVSKTKIQAIDVVRVDDNDRPGPVEIANTTKIRQGSMKQSSSFRLPPFIIGAGQGTTGTHSIHYAICSLGIPSLHYGLDCANTGKWFSKLLKNTTNARKSGLYDDYKYKYDPFSTYNGLQEMEIVNLTHSNSRNELLPDPHPGILLFWKWKEMKDCIDSESRKLEETQCPGTDDMARWAEDFKSLIDDVIQWRDDDDPIRNVGAIHDIPYTQFLPYIIESARRLRGQDPIILFSERDPEEWAHRRLEEHNFNFCRLDLIHGYNGRNNNLRNSHFDWFECIDRTIRAKEEIQGASNQEERVRVGLNEVFTSYKNLMRGVEQPEGNDWDDDDLHSYLKLIIEKYNNFWRDQSHLHWNLFENKIERGDIAKAAHKFFSSSGAFQKSQN